MDPGTFTYTAQTDWREHFRGSSAHNTIVVDRHSQAVGMGPFEWRVRPSARLRGWITNPEWDFADADHGVYRNLPDPVTHRRRVLFVKPRYWLVVDDLYGEDVHEIELFFQFAEKQVQIADNQGWVQSYSTDGKGLIVQPIATVQLDSEIYTGNIEPIRGWISQDYGLRTPAPLLRYSTVARLPQRVVTLLVPKVSNTKRLPGLTTEVSQNATVIRFSDWPETLIVKDDLIQVNSKIGHKHTRIMAF